MSKYLLIKYVDHSGRLGFKLFFDGPKRLVDFLQQKVWIQKPVVLNILGFMSYVVLIIFGIILLIYLIFGIFWSLKKKPSIFPPSPKNPRHSGVPPTCCVTVGPMEGIGCEGSGGGGGGGGFVATASMPKWRALHGGDVFHRKNASTLPETNIYPLKMMV